MTYRPDPDYNEYDYWDEEDDNPYQWDRLPWWYDDPFYDEYDEPEELDFSDKI